MTEPSPKCPEWARSYVTRAKKSLGAAWNFLADDLREGIVWAYFVEHFDDMAEHASAERFQANFRATQSHTMLLLRQEREARQAR